MRVAVLDAAVERVGGEFRPGAPVLGCAWEERALRLELERSLRSAGPADPGPCGEDHARRPGQQRAPADAAVTTAASRTAVPCPRCGTSPVAGDRFCEMCGADLRERPTAAAPGAADHVEIALDGRGRRQRPRARAGPQRGRGRAGPRRCRRARVAAVVCDGVSSTRSSRARRTGGRRRRARRPAGRTPQERARTRSAVAAAAAAAAALVPRGTPVAAVVHAGLRRARRCRPAVLIVGWVGDSRAYWLAEPGAAEPARLLTADHTAEAAAAAGTLDPAVAAVRPDAITRWLGADGDAEPDVVALHPGRARVRCCCAPTGCGSTCPDAAELAALALPALRPRRSARGRRRARRGRADRGRRGQRHRRRPSRPPTPGGAMTAPEIAVERRSPSRSTRTRTWPPARRASTPSSP